MYETKNVPLPKSSWIWGKYNDEPEQLLKTCRFGCCVYSLAGALISRPEFWREATAEESLKEQKSWESLRKIDVTSLLDNTNSHSKTNTFDDLKLPFLRLNSISFKNFKVFSNYTFNFKDKEIKQFNCFIGPNGCGKSTILSSIQLLFYNFTGMDQKRIYANLGRSVRHTEGYVDNAITNDNFLISANLSSSFGDYDIEIDRSGFIKNHPKEILEFLSKLCYYTRFDQELHNFQLRRDRWEKFKNIIESITGFKIEEDKNLFFKLSSDSVQSELLNKYVISFNIQKPKEKINVKECSDGERKLIKSFSTLLNLDYSPQIILIDNVEMHVESSRHIKLIEAIKSCYPDSQLFTTTHSYHISKNLKDRTQIYDLRIINSDKIVQNQPWRLQLVDEIKDALIKLESINLSNEIDFDNRYLESLKEEGKLLSEQILQSSNNCLSSNISDVFKLKSQTLNFLSKFNSIYIENLIKN